MGAEGPPARAASVPAPQGPRRRAAERLELLVSYIYQVPHLKMSERQTKAWNQECLNVLMLLKTFQNLNIT